MANRYEKRMTKIERVLVKLAEDVNKTSSNENDTKLGLGSEFFRSKREDESAIEPADEDKQMEALKSSAKRKLNQSFDHVKRSEARQKSSKGPQVVKKEIKILNELV